MPGRAGPLVQIRSNENVKEFSFVLPKRSRESARRERARFSLPKTFKNLSSLCQNARASGAGDVIVFPADAVGCEIETTPLREERPQPVSGGRVTHPSPQ